MSSDGGEVLKLIAKQPADSQMRVHVIAAVLRDLVKASGVEAELAFTLVMAELADSGFNVSKFR